MLSISKAEMALSSGVQSGIILVVKTDVEFSRLSHDEEIDSLFEQRVFMTGVTYVF